MNKKTIICWCLLFTLSIIWGSSFILMKKSLLHFDYIEVGFYRLIIAFIVFVPFISSTIKKIRINHILPLLIVSQIGTVFPAIIFAKSQLHIESSLAGMLNSLTPFFTLIIGIVIFDKKLNSYNVIGILTSLTGSLILLSPAQNIGYNLRFSLFIIIATFFYAVSINTIKEKLNTLASLDIAVASSFLSSIIPLMYILNTDINYNIEKIMVNFSSFCYIIILGIVCTSFAIITFNYLIKNSSALFASSTTYLIPVFAIIWGLLDHEIIKNHELLGISVILTGVFIMNK